MLFLKNKPSNISKCVLAIAVTFGGLSIGATAAVAADASGNYQKERAACMNGQSQQDRATCLKEAGAARGEAKRGNLNDGSASFQQNAQLRCSALPTADQDDCMSRARGQGTVSGSVGGGGVIKETVTIVPAPMPSGSEFRPAPVPTRQY